MARQCYVGIANAARVVPIGYIGVDGVAHGIKMCYVGVNGVARPCWRNSEPPTYYGTAPESYAAVYGCGGARAGNYAIWGGGYNSSGSLAKNMYGMTANLAKVSVTALSAVPGTRGFGNATTLNNSALFKFGKNVINVYDADLVRTSITDSQVRNYNAATENGDYAIFSGAATEGFLAVDKNLVTTSISVDITLGAYTAATNNGFYALFGGGNGKLTTIIAFDKNLVQTTSAVLSSARQNLSAERAGYYGIFAGGYLSSTRYDTADAYDKNLVKTTAPALSVARYDMCSFSINNCAIFAGGANSGDCSDADCYTRNLTRTKLADLSLGRRLSAAVAVGNYAAIAGGLYGDYPHEISDAVDIFAS